MNLWALFGSIRWTVAFDVVLLNDCDRGVQKLCDLIGWRSELEDLYTKGREKLLKQQQAFFEMKKAVAESVTEPVN